MCLFDSNSEKIQLKKNDLIRLIQGLHRVHSQTMTAKYYQKLCLYLDYPSINIIIELFGSWSNLLLEAHIVKDLTTHQRNQLNKLNTSNTHKVKKLNVTESLDLYAASHGPCFTMKEYTDFRRIHPEILSCNSIINKYTSWNKALLAHGYSSRGNYSKEDCLSALQQAFTEVTMPFTTTAYTKWKHKNSGPSLSTILKHFGDWKKVLDVLIIK